MTNPEKTKTLLMLGGGFLQKFVIVRAKELGYRVLVLDANPEAEGFRYADSYEVINIVDEEACLEYAQKNKIDGVLTAATDFGVLTMSKIAEELNLPGINYKSACIIKNKAKTRNCLYEAKADDTGKAYILSNLKEVDSIIPMLQFPIMVKPSDGSGSRGASKVETPIELKKACDFAIQNSRAKTAVIEPFIIGKEYGVESFVDNGAIHILAIMQKDMTHPPFYAELGHAIPSGLSEEVETRIKHSVYNALKALGVNHGSVNMDLLITKEGKVHIVDIGARMGGNLIGSHIVSIGTGIQYMDNMIKAAVGDSTDFNINCTPKPIATKLLALTPGKIEELPDFDIIENDIDVKILHHLKIGETIKEYHTNLDGCGYILATGKNVQEAKEKAQKAKELINTQIIRKCIKK